MRRIAIMIAFVLTVVFVLAFAATAFATTSPHGGYGSSTDYCTACHDVHEAAGDYVLTRESTVTAVCGTCHGLFGAPAPAGVSWTSPKTNFTGADPTASTKTAYKVNMSAMSASQMDAVPGHSLGVMYNGTIVRNTDTIPGGSATLKVMNSSLYSNESVTSFSGTQGLYCASCHTPHGTSGSLLSGTKLLSSKPNHVTTAVTDVPSFCAACHDKRDNVGSENNHPSAYCTVCHDASADDFPHTSTHSRLLMSEPDQLCNLCHVSGTLP